MLKITEYADRLISDLDDLDFIERVKIQQKNWIGKSKGAEIDFATTTGDKLRVYTTRCDTLFGATYMVIAPEHENVEKWKPLLKNYDEIEAYKKEAAKKSDFERTELVKDKTGVMLDGVRAINPATGKEIPIFISDYVLSGYGTGAIMAVPAHDERDWDFAKKFNLPIIEVVAGGNVEEAAFTDVATGKLVNSGFLNGLEVEDAKAAMIKYLSENGIGEEKVNFKLRDWVFSRQRYWGEPIPLVNCEKCGWVAIPENELPLELPDVTSYEPTANGESPLSLMLDWVNCKCPQCGGAAKRETDTMPQWAGSSWYFLRYCDPKNTEEFASREALEYWMPVDWYNGGMEHTTLHLLYSRFWSKFLYDLGKVPCKEPYLKRTSHGMILGENGEKMSKSRGNVVNPDDIVNDYGADTMRLYEMFIGDFEQAAPWNPQSIKGCKRFLERFYNLLDMAEGSGVTPELEKHIHKLIKKVTGDIDTMKFNTAIAAMMAMINTVYEVGKITKDELSILATILCPFAPHVAEEIYSALGNEGLASLAKWPEYDEAKTVDDTVEMPIQVNGKVKTTISISKAASKEEILSLVYADEKVKAAIADKSVIKEIVVPGKIINVVVK
jgi:leucyl-tRNA synthetase